MASAPPKVVAALIQDIKSADSKEVSGRLCRALSPLSDAAYASWLRKLQKALREANPEPQTAVQASSFVIQTLRSKNQTYVQKLLASYGLPVPEDLPPRARFKLLTLPVKAADVPDGDGIRVYVSNTSITIARAELLACAPTSEQSIRSLFDNPPEREPLEFHVRLRGIDAPEMQMPYGEEARNRLVDLVRGEPLEVIVYGNDRYGRLVGDVFCNGKFAQEEMLREGCAWHYEAYDRRHRLAALEKEAMGKGVGLWALPDPEEPWKWRERNRLPTRAVSHALTNRSK